MYIAEEMRQNNDITNTQHAENQHVTEVSSNNLTHKGTMKTLEELLEMMNEAIKKDLKRGRKQWFFHYSGHVQKTSVDFYLGGWAKNDPHNESVDIKLNDPNSIQEGYWFIKNRI